MLSDPPQERQISRGAQWRQETGVEVIFSLSQDRNDMSRLTTNIHNSHIIHRAGSGTGQQNLRGEKVLLCSISMTDNSENQISQLLRLLISVNCYIA